MRNMFLFLSASLAIGCASARHPGPPADPSAPSKHPADFDATACTLPAADGWFALPESAVKYGGRPFNIGVLTHRSGATVTATWYPRSLSEPEYAALAVNDRYKRKNCIVGGIEMSRDRAWFRTHCVGQGTQYLSYERPPGRRKGLVVFEAFASEDVDPTPLMSCAR